MVDEAGAAQSGEIPADALSLAEFVGQGEAVQRLKVLVELAKGQNRSLPHILLVGRRRTGKRTLAKALAKEMGVKWRPVVSQSIQSGGDLMGILTDLDNEELLFLEDVASF